MYSWSEIFILKAVVAEEVLYIAFPFIFVVSTYLSQAVVWLQSLIAAAEDPGECFASVSAAGIQQVSPLFGGSDELHWHLSKKQYELAYSIENTKSMVSSA